MDVIPYVAVVALKIAAGRDLNVRVQPGATVIARILARIARWLFPSNGSGRNIPTRTGRPFNFVGHTVKQTVVPHESPDDNRDNIIKATNAKMGTIENIIMTGTPETQSTSQTAEKPGGSNLF